MPITASDIKFLAAAKMNDEPDAGGRRSGTVLQSGVNNNVLPDPTADDRLQGRTRVRKLYPSVLSDEQAALAGATVVLNERPSDPLVDVTLIAYGDDNTTRQQLVDNALPTASANSTAIANASGSPLVVVAPVDGGDTVFEVPADAARVAFRLTAGDWLRLDHAGGSHVSAVVSVTSSGGAAAAHTVELADPFPGSATAVPCALVGRPLFPGPNRVYGIATTRSEAAATDTQIELGRSLASLVPDGTTYPTANLGLPPAGLALSRGRAPVLQSGDLATLWHEDATSPATATNGGTVNVGRTNLSQLAVVGANGLEIARFLADGPAVTGVGCSADLAAGTVTFSDVTGYSQPVSVRHRIEERVQLATVTPLLATLGAPLARTFPAGSLLASELPVGDLQATAGTFFSQQAWTKTWADTVIGTAIGTLYAGAVGLENDGAENDRWACIFTSLTQYRLESERLGVVGTGNIGTDYSPLNPATGQPLLTLYAAGWVSSGIAIGNVLRFNTRGAYAPVHMVQCIRPGTASGSSRAMARLRGSVDA